MTIGKNIILQAANWSNSAVGNGMLIRGHTDSSPDFACPASSDDSLNVVENDCGNLPSESDVFIERRTFTLSNGAVIWDFSGNVWEWTSYLQANQKATPAGEGWQQFINLTGTDSLAVTDLVPQVVLDNSWTSLDQAIGRYFPGDEGTGGAMRRGAPYNHNAFAGVFSANLGGNQTVKGIRVGFRCTSAVPQ